MHFVYLFCFGDGVFIQSNVDTLSTDSFGKKKVRMPVKGRGRKRIAWGKIFYNLSNVE